MMSAVPNSMYVNTIRLRSRCVRAECGKSKILTSGGTGPRDALSSNRSSSISSAVGLPDLPRTLRVDELSFAIVQLKGEFDSMFVLASLPHCPL